MPSSASPTVPTVPQDVPVASEINAQIRQVASRKIPGLRIASPQ